MFDKGKKMAILVFFGCNSVNIFENEDTYCLVVFEAFSSRWPVCEEKNNLKMKGSWC